MQIDSLELIGYDRETKTFPSTVYSNLSPAPLPYRWEIQGDTVTITVSYGQLDATFTGSWREDGTFGRLAAEPRCRRDSECALRHRRAPTQVSHTHCRAAIFAVVLRPGGRQRPSVPRCQGADAAALSRREFNARAAEPTSAASQVWIRTLTVPQRMSSRTILFAILGAVAVSLVLLVGYTAQTGDDRPKELIQQIHDRVSCTHPRPDSKDC